MEFNNREIASVIIVIGFLTYAIYKSKDRESLFKYFKDLLKFLFVRQIQIIVILFAIYIYYEIHFLKYIGYIDSSLIKESLIWSFGAFGLIVNHSKIVQNQNFIKKLIYDNLKFIALFEFICNMYTFNIVIEIILVFSTTILVMLKTYTELNIEKKDYKLILQIINVILSIVGSVIILFTINKLINDYSTIELTSNIKSFILPLIMISLYMPFYYLVILYSKYEIIFISMNYFVKDKTLKSYLKRKILLKCLLNYSKLKTIHQNIYNFKMDSSKSDIDKSFEQINF